MEELIEDKKGDARIPTARSVDFNVTMSSITVLPKPVISSRRGIRLRSKCILIIVIIIMLLLLVLIALVIAIVIKTYCS